MKRIFLLLAIISVLTGCSSAYKQSFEEAEAALESGEYENALKLYNTALEEKPDSSEAKDRVVLLHEYEEVKEKIELFNWTEAADLANTLLKNEDIVPSLQNEVKTLLVTIEEEKEKEKQNANDLKVIEKLISSDGVEEAASKLSELKSNIKSDALNSEIDNLYIELGAAKKRIAEKERLEKEAKQRTAEEKNLKNKYMQQAQELEHRIAKEASDLYANNPPPGFFGQYYNEWDDLLNEVWGVLKNTVSKEEFKEIKADQIWWVNNKEKGFAELPDETASTRAAGMDYLANLTEDRTFYLIGNHIK